MFATLAISWVGRAAMEWPAPGTRTSSVSTPWSFSAW